MRIESASDLDLVDALVVESGADVDTMTAHARARGLMVPLRAFLMSGKPVFTDNGDVSREFIVRNNLRTMQETSDVPPVSLVKLASLVRCAPTASMWAPEIRCLAERAAGHVLVHTMFSNSMAMTLQQVVFVYTCEEAARLAVQSDRLLELRGCGHGTMKRVSLLDFLGLCGMQARTAAPGPTVRLLDANNFRASCFCGKPHTTSVLSREGLDVGLGARIILTRVERVVVKTHVAVAPDDADGIDNFDLATKMCLLEAHNHLKHILMYRSSSSSSSWHPQVEGLLRSLFCSEQQTTTNESSYNIRGSRPEPSGSSAEAIMNLARAADRLCVEKKCAKCGKTKKLSFCEKCMAVYYCGSECQKAHWPVHKAMCKKY